MNADKYINVVNHKILNTMRDMQIAFPDGGGIFQHNLAPCHSAKKIRNCVTRKGKKGFRIAREFARLEPHRKFVGYH